MKINSLINHHFNYYIEYTIQLENYYLFNSRVMLLLPAGRATSRVDFEAYWPEFVCQTFRTSIPYLIT